MFNVTFLTGYAACTRNFTERINSNTKLQSEILLPCYFDSAFIKSNQNKETSVVWSHINTTIVFIVEIKVNGDLAFWDSRKGRIEAFPYVSGSGNFSILIHNVQVSDLGPYRCEIFRETNCSLLYKEISEYFNYSSWEWQLYVDLMPTNIMFIHLLNCCLIYVTFLKEYIFFFFWLKYNFQQICPAHRSTLNKTTTVI